MTLSEFKAWFEGFTENIEDRPNEKQWARIKARMKEIDDMPVMPIHVERFIEQRPWPYLPPPTFTSGGSEPPYPDITCGGVIPVQGTLVTSDDMMRAGRAEAASIG